MSAAEFLARFIVETNYGTGGNCTAWHLPMPGGFYVLVTMHDYPEQPEAGTDELDVGLYDPDGDEHELRERVGWDLAAAIVTDWIALVPRLIEMRSEFVSDREFAELVDAQLVEADKTYALTGEQP